MAALHCCRQVDVIGGIHPGTAFTELRFYPPGWVKQFHGRSCAARDWCAALTIGSLSGDPVNGITLNPAVPGRDPRRDRVRQLRVPHPIRHAHRAAEPAAIQLGHAGRRTSFRQACRT
jgi:hypothetical protein